MAAVRLAGTWRGTRVDLWQINEANYGPQWSEFQTEGFPNSRIHASSDATYTFQYGSLVSGTGQWFEGASPTEFSGASTVASAKDPQFVGTETKLVMELMDGDLLKITYTFQNGE
mmetsp:Transcript_76927/g.178428  ORF Transcript_76927/g.178428 Transcript_76927/m.178428 type:complete len:115 (-) Transcript_76927:258-602(-)